jgi:signal transduction histidine kinase
LARDLHDSVTQSLYSLTLFAEAGQRLMRSGEHERVEKYLERLGKTAQDALREMRLLLYELRPLAFQSGRLIEAIQQRLDAVERRAGLSAHLITTSLPPLSSKLEEVICHIALEALIYEEEIADKDIYFAMSADIRWAMSSSRGSKS